MSLAPKLLLLISLVAYTLNAHTHINSVVNDPRYQECGIFTDALSTWNNHKYKHKHYHKHYHNDNEFDVTYNTTPKPSLPPFISANKHDDYNIYDDIRIEASTSYADSNRKYMSIDSIKIKEDKFKYHYHHYHNNHSHSSDTINVVFTEGDYYINSWESDADLNVIFEGKVRFFIKGKMTLNGSNLDFNYNGGDGIASDIYVFIYDKLDLSPKNGEIYRINAYIYTQKDFKDHSRNNDITFNGAVSVYDEIDIRRDHTTYIYDAEHLKDDGFGPCGGDDEETPSLTGIFDAWQTSINDRNISTKIATKPFTLTIAALDEAKTSLINSSTFFSNFIGSIFGSNNDINIKYQLYEMNSTTEITSFANFNIKNSSTITPSFTINQAYKNVRVRFQYCHNVTNDSVVDFDYCTGAITETNNNGNDHGHGHGHGHGFGFGFGNGNNNDDDNVQSTYETITIFSSDNFAIRPEKFILSGTNLNSVISDDELTLSVNANTTNYTIANMQSSLFLEQTIFTPNNVIDNNLHGSLSFVYGTYPLTDGNGTFKVQFDDIGKVNIQLRDETWAKVDLKDTELDCNGAYICGDINATFIPDHFSFANTHLNNFNGGNYTYLSNDLNISANISTTIEAKNINDTVTQNFDSASWENDVSVTFAIASSPNGINKQEIPNPAKLGFSNGSFNLSNNELLFNFSRAKNIAVDPFIIDGSSVDLNVSSLYNSTEVSSVTNPDNNATFLYARAYIPNQLFTTTTYNAQVFYEVYCNDNSKKYLLPNSANSDYTNDPKWFINTSHTTQNGKVSSISEKSASIVTSTTPTGNHPDIPTLTYTGNLFPYKTTMQYTLDSWLIYNKDNANATTGEFTTEFYSPTAKTSNTDETSNQSATRVNRKLMW